MTILPHEEIFQAVNYECAHQNMETAILLVAEKFHISVDRVIEVVFGKEHKEES